jgi:hypothetical protein
MPLLLAWPWEPAAPPKPSGWLRAPTTSKGIFLEKPDVSLCREVHMKDRGRAMGGIAWPRLMRWTDQTLLASTRLRRF